MKPLPPFGVIAVVMAVTVSFASSQAPATPQAAVDELLAADRAFAAAAAPKTVVDGLAPMLATDAVMPTPAGFARGKDTIVEALRGNPDNTSGKVEWFPSRGGISADGQHGFTVGYMTLVRPDNSRVPVKYLAYWVKQPEGWRVAVYKRSRGAEGAVPREMLAPALPATLVKPSGDATLREKYRVSLEQAEKAFSDEAQAIGIGPAFAKHGSADAVNMGGPNTAAFIVGSEAIGKNVGAGGPVNESRVTWAADYAVLVASSGDVGATMGMIKRKGEVPAGEPAAFPFVTIWRRASPSEPWRYVAE